MTRITSASSATREAGARVYKSNGHASTHACRAEKVMRKPEPIAEFLYAYVERKNNARLVQESECPRAHDDECSHPRNDASNETASDIGIVNQKPIAVDSVNGVLRRSAYWEHRHD